ncbi:MAG TPA: DEAD/DEAH box helicase [Thermoanaerobaculia bacterium]
MNEISFRTLGLGPNILKAVDEAGYTAPTPIQHAAIPQILEQHDLIGIAQTGTGKTAAFVLPLLEMIATHRLKGKPCALIIAPTRELAMQTDAAVRTLAKHVRVRCAIVCGGVNERPQIDALRRGVDIVVATPGRLLDLMSKRNVSLKDVRFVVLDEADRMLDMGFLPQMRRIIKELPRERQTLLFSATLSRAIEQIAGEVLRSPKTIEIGRRSNPADTVAQYLFPVSRERKIDLLLHLLRDQRLDSVLVFSRTKHGADKIARKLQTAGIKTAVIHSNRSQSQRVKSLEAFRGGDVRVLVATDIAARGIDVEGISHVVNYDFPMHPEDYVHRIGRTGRAEAIGDAISFVTIEDGPSVHDLEKMIGHRIDRRRIEGFSYGESATLSAHHPSPAQRPPHVAERPRTRSRVW